MIKLFCLTIFSFLLISISGQNLVPNPGFEEYTNCPTSYQTEGKTMLIPHWKIPTKGTSDYFIACSRFDVGVPINIMGTLFAIEGKAYAGIILLQEPKAKKKLNYREYLQAELTKPLIKDSNYIVSLYFAVAPNSTFAVNRLGICFSEKELKSRKCFISHTPTIALDTNIIITERDSWHLFYDTIKAIGNERIITIGNFYPDTSTRYVELDLSTYRKSLRETIKINSVSYYYIDKISVESVTKNK